MSNIHSSRNSYKVSQAQLCYNQNFASCAAISVGQIVSDGVIRGAVGICKANPGGWGEILTEQPVCCGKTHLGLMRAPTQSGTNCSFISFVVLVRAHRASWVMVIVGRSAPISTSSPPLPKTEE